MTKKNNYTPKDKSTIADIDKSTLTDISEIKIDTSKPIEERIGDFIEKTKNPYCLIIDGCVVKSSFADDSVSINERLTKGLLNDKNISDK